MSEVTYIVKREEEVGDARLLFLTKQEPGEIIAYVHLSDLNQARIDSTFGAVDDKGEKLYAAPIAVEAGRTLPGMIRDLRFRINGRSELCVLYPVASNSTNVNVRMKIDNLKGNIPFGGEREILVPNASQWEITAENYNIDFQFNFSGKKFSVRLGDNSTEELSIPEKGGSVVFTTGLKSLSNKFGELKLFNTTGGEFHLQIPEYWVWYKSKSGAAPVDAKTNTTFFFKIRATDSVKSIKVRLVHKWSLLPPRTDLPPPPPPSSTSSSTGKRSISKDVDDNELTLRPAKRLDKTEGKIFTEAPESKPLSSLALTTPETTELAGVEVADGDRDRDEGVVEESVPMEEEDLVPVVEQTAINELLAWVNKAKNLSPTSSFRFTITRRTEGEPCVVKEEEEGEPMITEDDE